MSVPDTIARYLSTRGVDYDTRVHPPTQTSARTAEVAHVPGDRLAKGVLLAAGDRLIMAVVPASCSVDSDALELLLGCDLFMVDEEDLRDILRDCRFGAVPPIGDAYGIATVVDDSLFRQPDVYFEAGDHESLIHVTGVAFYLLMAGSAHGKFAAKA